MIMNSSPFETIYLISSPRIDYSTRYIKIINDNYIEYCRKKLELTDKSE